MLKKIDDGWYRLERFGVVGGFLLMSAVVFADVVHRLFSDTRWQTPPKLAAVWFFIFLVMLGGVRTAAKADQPWARSLGYGVGITLVTALLVHGFVWLMPSGLVWAQTLALILMIWVAFFGASIAAREGKHLKVDAADKIFKGTTKRWVAAFSLFLAALATGLLGVLAVQYCRYHYGIYAETEGMGGSFEGLPIPKHMGYAVIPLALFTMALRFLGHGVNAARGKFVHADEFVPHTEESAAAAASEPTTEPKP